MFSVIRNSLSVASRRMPVLRVERRQRRWRLRESACLLAVGTMMLTGCQSLESGTANVAQLRVIHASPDAPAVDLYAGKTALAYGVEFGSASSYVSLPAAATVHLTARTANSVQKLVTSKADLAAGHRYTAVVSNVAASLQETIYPDQTQPAPVGQMDVRIIDTATRAGALDLYLVPDSGKLTTTVPLRTALSFGESTGYISEPAGTYSLLIVAAGAVPVSSMPTLSTGPQISYAPGAVRTIVLVDRPGETGVDAIVADDYEPS